MKEKHGKLQWVVIAAFSIFVVLGIIGYYTGHFADRTNFQRQAVTFGAIAVALIVMGTVAGYNRYKMRMLWTTADLSWISITVLGFGAALGPVEDYSAANKIEAAELATSTSYLRVLDTSRQAAKVACKTTAVADVCERWETFAITVTAPGFSIRTLNANFDEALAKVADVRETSGQLQTVTEARNTLQRDIDAEFAARENARQITVGWYYGVLVVIILVLAMRAGKTGADYRKNMIEAEKDRLVAISEAQKKERTKGGRDDWR